MAYDFSFCIRLYPITCIKVPAIVYYFSSWVVRRRGIEDYFFTYYRIFWGICEGVDWGKTCPNIACNALIDIRSWL